MKLTRFITTISFLLIAYFANSQVSTEQYTSPYKKAIGFKLNPGAISYRSFYTRNEAVEVTRTVIVQDTTIPVVTITKIPVLAAIVLLLNVINTCLIIINQLQVLHTLEYLRQRNLLV